MQFPTCTTLPSRAKALAGTAISSSTRALFRGTSRDFDHAYGVDTGGTIPLERLHVLGGPSMDRGCYEGVSVKHFAFAMGLLPDPPERWSFVDIGSGKGRAVLLAMGYPFRRVVGVELVPELHAVAQENLRRYRGPRASPSVELICGDATKAPLPTGEVVIFFYNSFRGALLHRFLDHLEQSLQSQPR